MSVNQVTCILHLVHGLVCLTLSLSMLNDTRESKLSLQLDYVMINSDFSMPGESSQITEIVTSSSSSSACM